MCRIELIACSSLITWKQKDIRKGSAFLNTFHCIASLQFHHRCTKHRIQGVTIFFNKMKAPWHLKNALLPPREVFVTLREALFPFRFQQALPNVLYLRIRFHNSNTFWQTGNLATELSKFTCYQIGFRLHCCNSLFEDGTAHQELIIHQLINQNKRLHWNVSLNTVGKFDLHML